MRALSAFLLFVSLSVPAIAQPQLQDFAMPEDYWDAKISPDGGMLAMGCTFPDVGQREICLFDLRTGAPTGKVGTPLGRILHFYWINPDYLAYTINYTEEVYTSSGYETMAFYRTFALGVDRQTNARLMRDENEYTHTNNIVSVLNGDDEHAVMQISGFVRTESNRSVPIARLYRVNLRSGQSRRMSGTGEENGTSDYVLAPDGTIMARERYNTRTGRYAIERGIDRDNVLFEGEFFGSTPRIYGLIDSGNGLAVDFPSGEHRGLRRLDLETGTLEAFTYDGREVGRLGAEIDHRTGELVGFHYNGDLPGQILVDDDLASTQRALGRALGSEVELLSWTDDRSVFTFMTRAVGVPNEFYLFDSAQGAVEPIGSEAPAIAAALPSSVIPMSYSASDGMEIPAYLTVPVGWSENDAPRPLLLLPHGGPEARDDATYDWWASYYASLGYIVLKPNYRGSAGYGDAFRNAGYGEFGDRMIEDMLDGARHLVEQGHARDDGYCVIGASYGGYAALMAAIHAPGEVRCVVGVSAVTDPFEILGTARNRGGRDAVSLRYWENYIGTVFDSAEAQASITPVDRAGEITAPVLLLHGEEDTTVSVEQSEVFANVMRGRRNFRYVELEGEDHYLGTLTARQAVLAESTRFLEEHFPVD